MFQILRPSSIVLTFRRFRGSSSIDGLFMHTRRPKRRSPFPPSLLSPLTKYEYLRDVSIPKFEDKVVKDKEVLINGEISKQISENSLGRTFAVVHLFGKQRLITAEDIVCLEGHFAAEVGERIRLEKVKSIYFGIFWSYQWYFEGFIGGW